MMAKFYPLEHACTEADFDFQALKGADAAASGVLAAAAAQADCALHLALLTVEETGWAEYSQSYRGRRRSGDEDGEFEVGGVDETSIALSSWCATDGVSLSWGEIPVDENELSPPDAFDALSPDELHFEEASGNAGVSFERRYQRAGQLRATSGATPARSAGRGDPHRRVTFSLGSKQFFFEKKNQKTFLPILP